MLPLLLWPALYNRYRLVFSDVPPGGAATDRTDRGASDQSADRGAVAGAAAAAPPSGAAASLGRGDLVWAIGPLMLATLAMGAANLIGHGRLPASSYGNVFVLARGLVDGPAMDALRRHCPRPGWRLCVLLRHGQPRKTGGFLWRTDSALYREGAPKRIAAEVGAILLTTLRGEPLRVIRAAPRDTARRLVMVRTGDGLEPWRLTVTLPSPARSPARKTATKAASHGLPCSRRWQRRWRCGAAGRRCSVRRAI